MSSLSNQACQTSIQSLTIRALRSSRGSGFGSSGIGLVGLQITSAVESEKSNVSCLSQLDSFLSSTAFLLGLSVQGSSAVAREDRAVKCRAVAAHSRWSRWEAPLGVV